VNTRARSELAEKRLLATGERVTEPRRRVLATLLAAEQALSHTEIEHCLEPEPLDRVTLYRVLEWLVERGLAHRYAGADRVWRFMASDPRHEAHAHFQCEQCGKVRCLSELGDAAAAVGVPRGYRARRTEVTVKGDCPDCA
jgi:Fur family transcriptional regulator, ferric uptake regulator